jgi:phosphohistidine phosphatase SixA
VSDCMLRRNIRWGRIPVGLAAVAVLGTAQPESLSDAALVKVLRQGGCVLVMRHASSPAALPDKITADPENVTGERQLDEVGRNSARAMGTALKALRIPIAQVLSSPAYRARETVRLAALGTPEVVAELDVAGQNNMQAAANPARSAWLHHRVTISPPAGSNTLIVTHAPNILGAFAQSASSLVDGETLVFHPDGKGAARLLARVAIEDWPHLAAADSTHEGQ